MKLDLNEVKHIFFEDSRRAIWVNLGAMAFIGLCLVILFFYIYLPITTHKDETISVPDLEGMQLKDVEEFLDDRELRYYVADSSYDNRFPPLAVLKQDPAKGAKVKVNRRIHITLNSLAPPMERLPNIIDNSMKQASQILESYGFKIGNIKYVSDIAANAVIKVFVNNKEVTEQQLQEGYMLAKGSKIDLHVGDGMGNNDLVMPDFSGLSEEEAEVSLRGNGLGIGAIIYEKDAAKEIGTVIRQKPTAGTKIKVGTIVDLWVAGER